MPRVATLFTLAATLSFLGCSVSVNQPVADPADIKTAVACNTQFALDLYGQLREQPGNLFFSPYSISAALAMTYGGARTQTAEEMAKTLHFTLQDERLHATMGKLQADLNGANKKRAYQLNVANALWGQKNYGFLPDFLNLTRTYYGAGFNEVDFVGNTEAARKTINDWVEKQTQDKIKELLKPGVLDGDTRLVLTNAIYFKGNWLDKFDPVRTANQPFSLSAGDKVDVPMMEKMANYGYCKEGNVEALQLPYAGKELSMVVLLPNAVDGLADVEKALTVENVQKLLGNLRDQEVNVLLPKFKMTSEFELNVVLKKLGMERAFDPHQADFSGMSGSARKLYISAVIHMAFVEVNEEGTEAAAATAVMMAVKKKSETPPPPTFRADHPFLFLIRDNRTGAILFMGRVVDPRKA